MSTILSTKQGGIVTQYENTNFSTAKQKFSFGKGPRFPSVKKQDTEITYTLPSGFGRRAPSFGIGDRFDHLHWNRKLQTLVSLTDNIVDNSPSPGSYRLQSDFDPESSMNKSKAFSFGISREAYEKVYIPSQKTSVQKDIPGPG